MLGEGGSDERKYIGTLKHKWWLGIGCLQPMQILNICLIVFVTKIFVLGNK